MMVDKAPAIGLIQVCISGAVEAFEQEGFDDVLFYEEKDDEDDGEDEGGVGGQFGEGGERNVFDVFVTVDVGVIVEH